MGRTAVHQPSEEGAAREHHGPAREFDPHAAPHAADAQPARLSGPLPSRGGLCRSCGCRRVRVRGLRSTVGGRPLRGRCGGFGPRLRLAVEEQLDGRILPDVEVVGVLQRAAPLGREGPLVALRTGTPHGRPLRAVEHAELQRREVGDAAHLTSECVYLSDNLSFSYSADCRVARHFGEFDHIHRQQQRARAESCGGRCGLATGVTSADDDYIVVQSHLSYFSSLVSCRCFFSLRFFPLPAALPFLRRFAVRCLASFAAVRGLAPFGIFCYPRLASFCGLLAVLSTLAVLLCFSLLRELSGAEKGGVRQD